MPIQRILLRSFCLVMLGAASAVGQQNNPLAEWDRTQPKSNVARPTSKTQKSSVTYFSPRSAESAAEKNIPEAVKQIPMRERASVAAQPTVGNDRSATSAQKTAASGSKMPKTTVAVAEQPIRAAAPISEPTATSRGEFCWQNSPGESQPVPVGSRIAGLLESQDNGDIGEVTQATFERSGDSANIGQLIRVSGAAGKPAPTGEEENPFVNFLRNSEKTEAEPVSDFPANEPRAASLEGESTEASFLDKSATSGTVAGKTTATTASGSIPRRTSDVASEDNGPQSPGITVQWVRKGSFNVGQECDVELVVQNTSKAVVRSVMTEAVIPAEVEIIETIPSPIQGTDVPTWTFGELKPGESRSVALKVVPRQRGDVRLDAFVRLTGYSSSEFSVEEPMIGVAVTGPENVEVGQQAGYVVRVSNPGTGIASNVVIQAAIPEGFEHRSGSLLTIEIGTLNPGESRQARLSLTAVKGGAHDVAVRVLAEGGLSDETVAAVSVSEPQLKIDIAGPAEQMAGRTGEYTLTVANAGNLPTANVRAKYRIPAGFEYVSGDRGGKYSKVDHSIEWFVGTLQPNDAGEFKVSLKANETGELMHQAGVISEHGQVTMCDLVTAVEGTAALDLKITASDADLVIGDEVEWTVVITNTGSRKATGVGMSCELPSGLTLTDASGPSEHIADNGVTVFRSLPSIEAGKDAVFTIKARCNREGSHRLRLRVASESITEPLIGEESTLVVGK